MEMKFERNSFGKRLKSMLKVDIRRMFTMRLFYIMAGISLVIPILVLVMTTMMDGSVSVDPTTGAETVMEGFDNTWQAIGSVSSENFAMDMSLTGMCNINLIYFLAAILVCLFVTDDFRSGYAKNLFAVRSKKNDYIISKMLVGFVGSACMLLCFFVGAMLGGAIAGLPFDAGVAGTNGIVLCMLSKLLLSAVFVPIYVTLSVVAKQKAWLAIICSLGAGMLLFTMIPMLTPLDARMQNVIVCLAGGIVFSTGLGCIGKIILQKTSLV